MLSRSRLLTAGPHLLSSRSLHIVTTTRSNFHDPELLILHHLANRSIPNARRLLDETPQWKNSVVRCTSALSRFARDGFIDEARLLFDLMPNRNIVTWNAMLSAYVHSGLLSPALHLFRTMPDRNVVSYTSILSGLARAGRIRDARALFDAMPERNVVSYNSMIAGLVRNGDLDEAEKLFDEMPERSAASYNAVIAGFAERGRMEDARRLFEEMNGSANTISWSTMIAGYCRVGEVWTAYDLFRSMIPFRNVVSWTAMIGGFAWNGFYEQALLLFKDMKLTTDVKPNGETVVSLIYACSGLGFPRLGKQVHAHVMVQGLNGGDQFGKLSKGLIHMYSRFGLMDWAHHVFNRHRRTCDAACWNSMIDGYVRIGDLNEARRLFDEITADPNAIDWITMLVTWTTMIAAYLDAGDVAESRRLFDRIPERDGTAWTAMISGLARNGRIADSFRLLSEMRGFGFAPMDHALAAILGAVGSGARLEIGEQIHGLLITTRPESDTILSNALMSMYFKSGDVEAGYRVFGGMTSRDVVTWNAVIAGLAQNGRAHEAVGMFEAMRREGVADGVTCLAVLTACSHVGMVDRGLEIFEWMVGRGGVAVGPEHYACVVGMLGRAGLVQEAERFAGVEPGVEVLGAMLGTCEGRRERAAKRLLEWSPLCGSAHVALCHVYAEKGGYEEEGKVRREMRGKGVEKIPGCSWIGSRGRVHAFLCGG